MWYKKIGISPLFLLDCATAIRGFPFKHFKINGKIVCKEAKSDHHQYLTSWMKQRWGCRSGDSPFFIVLKRKGGTYVYFKKW